MRVVIVGNGILALSTAHRLISRDDSLRITIVGPKERKGCASLAALAMLNSFCTLQVGTLENPRTRERFLFNKSANAHWPDFLQGIELASGMKIDHGFGTFLLDNHPTNPKDSENFDAIVAGLREFGEPFETVDPRDIPGYNPSTHRRDERAIFLPGEGWLNPVDLVESLELGLRASGRVEFAEGYCGNLMRTGNRVDYVALENGTKQTGDFYYVAPGSAFSEILARSNLGIKTPMIVHGVGCTIVLKTVSATPPFCIRTPTLDTEWGIYAVPRDGDHVVLGSTHVVMEVPVELPLARELFQMLRSAAERINAAFLDSRLVSVNLGRRPVSEDGLPLLGKTSLENLVVATGTNRDGLHCSPIISGQIADLILDGRTGDIPEAYSPERGSIRV